MRELLDGRVYVGAHRGCGQRLFIAVFVRVENRLYGRPHPVHDCPQVWRTMCMPERELIERRYDRATIRVPEHNDKPGPKLAGGKFDAANLRRGDDVTGDTDDEEVAKTLVEHQLDWNPGVGAGENNGERRLFSTHARLVSPMSYRSCVNVTRDKAAIAITQYEEGIFSGFHECQYLVRTLWLQGRSARRPTVQEYGRACGEVTFLSGELDVTVRR